MAKSVRLSKEDWLRAGLRALAEEGPGALKAEPLASSLSTTKGSFYWHFPDVAHFHRALFDHWEQTAYGDIVAAVESAPTSQMRMRRLGEVAARAAQNDSARFAVEPAIRAWARTEPAAARAVKRVDRQRLDYLQDLLGDAGLTNTDLARVIYAALIGLEDLHARDGADIAAPLGTLIDLILATA